MSSSDHLSHLQGLTIWRGEWMPDDKSLPEDKVGMHWATDSGWASGFVGGPQAGVLHRAVIDDPETQVIPPGRLIGGRGRDKGQISRLDNFGPNREVNEVRLRPGAQIRILGEQWRGQEEETVFPEGTHKTVEHPFRSMNYFDVPTYRNLASQSVPGTPQQAQHAREEADFAAGVPIHE